MTELERVHAVFDHWDQAVEGVADFQGRPHSFRRVFSEVEDDWTNLYDLRPLDEGGFVTAMEVWEIFLRWYSAFEAGSASRETHPALPEDAPRKAVAEREFEAAVERAAPAFRVEAEFRYSGPHGAKLLPEGVKWSALSS